MISVQDVLVFLQNGIKNLSLTIIVIIATIILQKIVSKLITNSFKRASKHLKVDETNYRFSQHLVSGLIYTIGFAIAIYTIPSLRTVSVSLFAGAGILAAIVGFASQNAFANIVSGIFIVIFKPFRVGDRVSIGNDIRGIVEDINLRQTTIRNFENKRIIVPNSIISNENIENASIGDEKICKFIEFGISYDSDVDLAMKIMQDEAKKHPLHIDNRSEDDKKSDEPEVKVRLIGFGDSSVNLRAWVWTKNPPDAFVLGCDLNESIKKRFDKEGIEIPFPYRTIVYKNNDKKNSKKISDTKLKEKSTFRKTNKK